MRDLKYRKTAKKRSRTRHGVNAERVKMHVSNILSKLHLADRTQAAIFALQKQLIPLNEALDS